MKTINTLLLLVMTLALTGFSYGQEEETDDQSYLILSYNNFNEEKEDFKMSRWLELEKEYRTRVLNNNEYINNFITFTHNITDDSSEIIHLYLIRGWDNIRKMEEANAALIEKAWPDTEERKKFFDELWSYYTADHSDEIYYALPYYSTEINAEDIVVRINKRHTKTPLGSAKNNKEFMEMNAWLTKEIMPKNEYVKGYFPYTHAWGSSGTEYLEIWAYATLDDIEKSQERMNELVREGKSEEEMKVLSEQWGKYFVRGHADYIYSRPLELTKRSINEELSK